MAESKTRLNWPCRPPLTIKKGAHSFHLATTQLPSRAGQRKPWLSATSALVSSPPSINKNGHVYNGKHNHQGQDCGRTQRFVIPIRLDGAVYSLVGAHLGVCPGRTPRCAPTFIRRTQTEMVLLMTFEVQTVIAQMKLIPRNIRPSDAPRAITPNAEEPDVLAGPALESAIP